MRASPWIALGAAAGFCSVALGAFGAHALRGRLDLELLAVYQTGVQYLMFHALALLAVGALSCDRPQRALSVAGSCFGLGALLFSASLIALALTGVRALGIITPIGGVLMLAGWASLLVAALRRLPSG